MRARVRVDKALMKSIGWCEFAPISHRITDIASRSTPGRGDNAIALHTKSIGPGTLLFLLCVNREISLRRWLLWDANRTGDCHQAAIAFHHINVFFRERNLHLNSRRVVWTIRCHMVRLTDGHAPCGATGEEQEPTAGSQ